MVAVVELASAWRGAVPSEPPLLSVRNVCVRFGGIVALDWITFDIQPGEIAGLIGPHGAGKTTLFDCLSPLYIPNEGDILFEDRSILASPRRCTSASRGTWRRCSAERRRGRYGGPGTFTLSWRMAVPRPTTRTVLPSAPPNARLVPIPQLPMF